MAVLEYPVQLGLAYLFLVGYIARAVFVSLELPSAVGAIFAGFAFSYFFQEDLFYARDQLQALAFFLVLLTAGLEIRLRDLRPYIFLMAFLPATFEILALACYGVFVLGYNVDEGLVLGTVLVSLGDGLVIPKMKEFKARHSGHPLPVLVFAWAPLEASYALTLFGILVGLSAPANQPDINMSLLVVANILRVVATVVAGAVLGAASGWLVPRRKFVAIFGKQVFTGSAVEAFLMILAVALFAFALGSSDHGKELIPMGFSPGSLFQPELLVIVTGCFFSASTDEEVVSGVESVLAGVWVFGQIVLFGMLGSRTTTSILPQVQHFLPLIAVGLALRLVGVFVAISIAILSRASGHPFQKSSIVPDTLFCFLSTCPRATIQGALGSVPVTQRFFQGYPHQHGAQDVIFTAARLYIVCMSVFGMTLLNSFGPKLLGDTSDRSSSGQVGEERAQQESLGDIEVQSLSPSYQRMRCNGNREGGGVDISTCTPRSSKFVRRKEMDLEKAIDSGGKTRRGGAMVLHDVLDFLAEEYSVDRDALQRLLKAETEGSKAKVQRSTSPKSPARDLAMMKMMTMVKGESMHEEEQAPTTPSTLLPKEEMHELCGLDISKSRAGRQPPKPSFLRRTSPKAAAKAASMSALPSRRQAIVSVPLEFEAKARLLCGDMSPPESPPL